MLGLQLIRISENAREDDRNCKECFRLAPEYVPMYMLG